MERGCFSTGMAGEEYQGGPDPFPSHAYSMSNHLIDKWLFAGEFVMEAFFHSIHFFSDRAVYQFKFCKRTTLLVDSPTH
jgi:hypothetical protein